MNPTLCPTCGREVRISGGGTKMEWDVEGRTESREGDFHKSWVCPFCYAEQFASDAPGSLKEGAPVRMQPTKSSVLASEMAGRLGYRYKED